MQKNRFPFFVFLALLFHLGLLGLLILWTRGWYEERPLGGGGGAHVLVIHVGGGVKGDEGEEKAPAPLPQPAPPLPKKGQAIPIKVEKKPSVPAPAPVSPPPLSLPQEPSSAPPEPVGKKGSEAGGIPSGEGGTGSSEGSGSGPGMGAGTGAGSGSGKEGSKVLAEIHRKIERAKRYPPLARLRQIEGVVSLSFVIRPGGEVAELKLMGSSGQPLLDEEALATVRRAAPLPYYPSPIRISLRFNLENE